MNFISDCFSKIKRFFDECKKFDREYAKQFSFSSEEPCDYLKFYKIDGEKDEDYKDNIGEYPVDVDDENCIEIVLDSEVLTKHVADPNISESGENIPFEEVYKKLEEIVTRMEKESLDLESALKAFEEGKKNAEQCRKMLDEAELKLKNLREAGKPEQD